MADCIRAFAYPSIHLQCEYIKVCSGQCREQQLLLSGGMDIGDYSLCPLTLRKAMSNQTRCE